MTIKATSGTKINKFPLFKNSESFEITQAVLCRYIHAREIK